MRASFCSFVSVGAGWELGVAAICVVGASAALAGCEMKLKVQDANTTAQRAPTF